MLKFYFLFVIILYLKRKHEAEAASVRLLKAYDCPFAANPLPLTMNINVKRTYPNSSQLMEFKMDVPEPIHTNTKATAKVEYNPFGNSWTQIAKFDDRKGMCNIFATNGGATWVEVRRAIGMPPKGCPIPKGKFHGDHILLDLGKDKIQAIPPGNYRGTIEARNKSDNKLIFCIMLDFVDGS